MFGSDLANSRSNPTSAISPASFGSFHRVWQFQGPAVTSTPAVVDGVVYFSGWDAKVYAVHAADGSPIWTAAVPHLVDSSPAVTADRVFVGDNNGFVHALDRNSGAVAWSRAVETVGLPHLWSSPVAIPDAGLVVVGVASAEESNAAGKPFTFRGSIAALDTATGDKRWQAYTTSNDFTSGPGIGIWSTAAVDPELKLLYIGTGNAYTAPAGQYTDSLLAIRYDTGAVEWAHQFQPGDVFEVYTSALGVDADVGAAANLFSAGGRDLVGVGVKNGNYYALDRKTGVQVWQRYVSTGSQLGGVMGATAYANGVVFVAGNERTAGKTTLMAINAADGAVLWTYSASSTTYASLAQANGVVYLGTTSGMLHAVDAASGHLLWSDMMPNGIGGGPSVGDSLLFAPWGFVLTFLNGTNAGQGGLIAYGP
jgi:polyvinyl alcohol dehydrogenase (cytochrome)